ncbi:MAG TPA: phosphotransferase family protein [Ilumatobacteraceae bacterium]|nr:phosphotransferase family protein [Ilumatobacteraceae bacterium]
MNDVPGIDIAPVTAWLEGHVPGARGPFSFEVIAGGHSNLTYRVVGADGAAFVLRRPPLGHRLASAHDMAREHRVIAALQRSAVPVAPALGLCADDTVNGAPFYVMGFVDGHVVRDRAIAEQSLTLPARRRAGESLVETMAAIHAVDLDAVGLADLGLLQVYWTGPGDEASAWGGSATTAEGFLDRADLTARYEAISGRDLSQLPFYVSFAYWKLACILQGVYYRYLGGALGTRDPAELEPYNAQIDLAAERATQCLEALP